MALPSPDSTFRGILHDVLSSHATVLLEMKIVKTDPATRKDYINAGTNEGAIADPDK